MAGFDLETVSSWANLYAKDIVCNIPEYVSNRSHGQNTHKYMRDALSPIMAYWDGVPSIPVLSETSKRWDDPPCKDMFAAVPWLTAFTDQEDDMKDAMEAVAIAFNPCTRLLMRFLVVLGNDIVIAEWKLEALQIIKQHAMTRKHGLLDEDAMSISNYIQRQCERGDVVVDSLWKSLQKATENYHLHANYEISSSKVANFCLQAGSPSMRQDALKNVQTLREYLASSQSGLREAEMRREIEELRSANKVQQRIITNLTFRHLLENLPPMMAKHSNSTARWTSFFKNALNNAQKQVSVSTSQHPLTDVIHKYDNVPQIERGWHGALQHFQYKHSSFQQPILTGRQPVECPGVRHHERVGSAAEQYHGERCRLDEGANEILNRTCNTVAQ